MTAPPPAEAVMVISAPNGARRTHADHPALPITSAEIAACAQRVRDAGAGMLHMHVRDDAGGHSLDAGRYAEATAAVREAVGDDLVIQITTEAVGVYGPAEQMATVRALWPEAASCALRELCPDEAGEAAYGAFLRDCAEAGVQVQHILYDAQDSSRFTRLWKAGLIPGAAPLVLLVLGRYGDGPASAPDALPPLLAALGDAARSLCWSVCAFGPREHEIALAASARGGHARLGFENNLWRSNGRLARDNSELIADFTAALARNGRRAATPAEIRSFGK